MTEREILDELTSIFKEVFDDETLTIGFNTSAFDIPEWDSLSHISLINEIEARFSIKFNMKSVVKLQNVGEMVKLIESLC